MAKISNYQNFEEKRRKFLSFVRNLSNKTFNLEEWEKLKKEVYYCKPLNVDVIVDDTTLREGLQMAELTTPTPTDMCKIACLLRDIGVERIEVITYTKSDQEAIKMMHDEGLGDMLAGWCRANKNDVDLALKLDFKQVGISHPVSYIHLEKWHDEKLEKIVENIVSSVEYAVNHGLTVFFHGEDSTRADWDFEKNIVNAVAEAGASVYRICDTVGIGVSDPEAPLPSGIPAKVRKLKEETSIPYLEIHAHDDLGNAVENTMAAIRAASGLYDKFYVSTTFLGIGDRAGNAETEKIIMNCYMHHNIKKWNLSLLRYTANYIATALNYYLPLNKAIVGDAAFQHESGIHLHGIKILPITYEVFPPELVGQKRRIIIGRRSGKHGIQMKIEEKLGKPVDENDPRLLNLIQIIREKYSNEGRRFAFTEDEFNELLKRVGFLA
ncbi:MAG: hypothetical protein B6U77_01605 [Candidatus Hecatellales archaeon ex4484_218]|nr:MAG: hypothetical protein B6U77_01605 [Candidatus Hecatellales archaeon ex4484_218]